MRIGGLEAGGTKMVLCVGNENGEIYEKTSIPTKKPEETMPQIIEWFGNRDIVSLGIGCFGPIDVVKGSKNYGKILDTPKKDWVQYDFLGKLTEGLSVPMEIDTDVNASCLGEMTFGVARGLDSVLYITIGTGIGIGIAVDGKLVHGMLHPEAGHIIINRHSKDKGACICPYHTNCFEGLASGPSLEKRWGVKANELADNTLVWEIESYYIAEAIINYILTVSPRKIILGGGVMNQKVLFPLIRTKVKELLGGYLNTEELRDMDTYIVENSLNDNQGILGALELGKIAFMGGSR